MVLSSSMPCITFQDTTMYQDKIIPRPSLWPIIMLCISFCCAGAIAGILGTEVALARSSDIPALLKVSNRFMAPLLGALVVSYILYVILYNPAENRIIRSRLTPADHDQPLTRLDTGQWVIFALPDGKGGLDRIFLNGERLYTPVDVRRLTVSAFSAPNGTSYADWEKENLP